MGHYIAPSLWLLIATTVGNATPNIEGIYHSRSECIHAQLETTARLLRDKDFSFLTGCKRMTRDALEEP